MRKADPTAARLLVPLLAIALLSGCSAAQKPEVIAAPRDGQAAPATTSDVTVISDLDYGESGDPHQRLDACLPPEADALAARPAIVLIHGGSWTRGDKADPIYADICNWLATQGYATFSVNYRLAPVSVFPAARDDVELAVRWLRQPAQTERFAIDPARIAAFGGSACGNLAALLGTRGSGALDSGSRVAAVVELSGPVDLTGANTTPEFLPVQLSYLGCNSEAACPAAKKASPLGQVDASDAPFLIAHSTDELIPIGQSGSLVAALRAVGVEAELIAVDGKLHSVAMLDDSLRQRILDFLAEKLHPAGAVT